MAQTLHRDDSHRSMHATQMVGTAPGTLIIDPNAPFPKVRVVGYSDRKIQIEEDLDLYTLGDFMEAWPKVWIHVAGLGDEVTLVKLSNALRLHQLAMEDVVNLEQRAKIEPYGDQLFIILRKPARRIGATQQVSMFLGKDFVLTFQEQEDDCLDPVLERMERAQGQIRGSGPDYLAYCVLDAVIDSYFPVLEIISDRLGNLEEEVLKNPSRTAVLKIHAVKRELRGLRRGVWPHRETINALLRDAGDFVTSDTSVYLRDCYDHIVSLMDLVESYREFSSDLMSTYLSITSNRMNEVMKVLSIVATIFIPLSFIAGVYGMNFDPAVSGWNMPELHWVFGYPFALALMGFTVAAMLFFFSRKGWFD